ncbi:bifunctional metallophosphatase/5'-nucleotidase [Candidatus Uabimicrobium amorphum]|uniref:Multifunctional 2',3'-cyclic-nucleotide2'-phosphodiesterase/5'-nucleotidase/3'-nucleotidase n=1 Tax=Uabimicrobium amorphum TaxID=2596890 RepID=A0A5S9II81_UABAM|nr:5'-nucleotidase C-terminal domain-containing protein [Candidatus Uabimicrobium amorphum]BBM81946.1 multifunctional 2',3'-cyclic-nucleotide2'-phosphodiesterase/5'-nucleotidase/3'-nucleotidase [Candidatus Uabimicrobium amorphum]
MQVFLSIVLVLLAVGCTTNQVSSPNSLTEQKNPTQQTTNAINQNDVSQKGMDTSSATEQNVDNQNVDSNITENDSRPVEEIHKYGEPQDTNQETQDTNQQPQETDASDDKKDTKILYLTSWEASLLPQTHNRKKLGGLAYLTQAVKKIEESSHVVLCTTGNFFRGDVKDRRPVVKALNIMGLDVCNISNLELNYGSEELKDKLEDAQFTPLCANIYEGNTRLFSSHTIVRKNEKRIAFIGLTSREAAVQSIPQAVENLIFRKPANELQKILAKLKNKADIVVVLSNLRHSDDIEIAKAFPSVNLIIGRHDVDTQNRFVKINNTMIVRSSKKKGVQLGEVNITELSTPQFHDIGPDASKFNRADSESTALIAAWQNMEKIRSEVLCQSKTFLEGEYSQIRQKETNLGNLLADIMLEKRSQADFAIINSGAIRASISIGDVTYGMVLDVLPYQNKVVALKISGKAVKEVLENAVARYESIPGAFLQVGGMSFHFSESKPIFSRVSEIKIQGEPLNLNKEYEMLTLDYIASGGDDYIMLKEIAPHYTSNKGLPDIIADYLRKKDNVYPRLEQRIVKE